MGGGNDLNLKKSWHPQLMTNQRRVFDAEQAALQERKITEARIDEIRRERQIEETQKQLEASGGPKRVDRVDWMYQGPNDGGRDEFSSEAFLLGKRRIDSILRGDDAKTLEKPVGPTGSVGAPVPIVASARDTAAKIREDPLVAIKRQEQEAYQAMMKDPSRRRQLLAQMGMAEEEPKKRKEERHRSHKHRSYRDRDDDERRRRRDNSRDRSRSPRRRDDEDSDYERRRRSRRSDSRERTRERHRYGSRDRRESRRRDYADSDQAGSRRRDDSDDDRKESRRRDYAYDDRKDSRRKDYSYDERKEDRRRGYHDKRRNDNVKEERARNRDIPSRGDAGARRNGDDEEEKARKLAAMQSDATDLDRARQSRLAALAQKEQAEREADDRARAKSQRYGGRDFANRLHNSAGNESLADRIGRGRQGLQREDA